jgi:hypothetical protein
METADIASISAASMSGLSTLQIVALTTAQAAALNSSQIVGLTTWQVLSLETQDLASLATVSVQALATANIVVLGTTQVQSLPTNSIVALTTAQFAALSSAQMLGLSTAQVASMETVDIASLSTATLMGMSTLQIVGFTTAQAAALTSAQIFGLATLQISRMETRDIAALATIGVRGLATLSIAVLSTYQMVSLSTLQVRALTTAQIVAIPTADVRVMTTAQIAALTTCSLTVTQKSVLSLSQVSVYRTPIVLDLNGDGVKTLALGAGVRFDLAADGQAVQTGWVSAQDGLLVRDVNHDGTINNGAELFGSSTTLADGSRANDGYQALAELDSNHDGVISQADAAYGELGVWVDGNSDGVSQSAEIRSLSEMGITQVSTQTTAGDGVDNGNILGLTSSYQTSDGVSHAAADVWFQTAPSTGAGLASGLSGQVSGLAQAIGAFDTLPLTPGPNEMPIDTSTMERIAVGTLGQSVGQMRLAMAQFEQASIWKMQADSAITKDPVSLGLMQAGACATDTDVLRIKHGQATHSIPFIPATNAINK